MFSSSLICESIAAQFPVAVSNLCSARRANSCGERFSFLEDNESRTFYNSPEALGSFNFVHLRGAGTGFLVVLPLPLSFDPPLNILHFTIYTTFHREATLKAALELLDYSIWDYSVMIWSQAQTTPYSPSKSIIECVKFRKTAEL